MKKLVITGALGHIGSALIRSIKPGDYDSVVLIDNLTTQRYASLFALPEGIPFRFVEEDIMTADLTSLFAGASAVVHLAAITNAEASVKIAPEVERVNFGGTERVALTCAALRCPMIFISTTSVYGSQAEIVDERCALSDLKPQSPYAASKLRAEQRLAELGADKGLRFVICRFGTIYGWSVGMRFHTAINKFSWQAVMGLPVTVWKTALNQKRPYLSLTDAVRALHHILQKNLFDGQVYNVLTSNATVGEILDVIRHRIPGLQVSFVESAIMNQLSYHVRNDKFIQTGFQFEGQLADGIGGTLDQLKALAR